MDLIQLSVSADNLRKLRYMYTYRMQMRQECTPVGCVAAAHWPLYRSLLPGGVSTPVGVSARGVSAPGGCLLWGVSAVGGVCSGVVCSRGGGVWRGRPPCEQNDRQVQKYYRGHNFVATCKNTIVPINSLSFLYPFFLIE